MDFTQRMNRITEMKIKENQNQLDFLQEKINAFEEIIPANVSKTLEMTDNILRVTYSKSKTEIEKKIGDMERKIASLSEKLKTYRKNAKNRLENLSLYTALFQDKPGGGYTCMLEN